MATPEQSDNKPLELSSDELLAELEATIAFMTLATVKAYAKAEDSKHGRITCPICLTGTLQYSVAPNGHVGVSCNRTWTDDKGETRHCIMAME